MHVSARFIRRTAVYFASVAAIIAITIIELRSADPHLPKTWVVVLAVVVGITGPLDAFARSCSEEFGPQSHALDVEDEVKALFLTLVEVTTIPWTHLGITVFAVRRSRRLLLLGRIQDRIYRLRIESHPRPTDILWTRKKGVLGECWRSLERATLDHTQQFAEVSGCRSRWDWISVRKDLKMGHRYSDYLKIRHFGYVEAHPAIDVRGKYRGCLVIQVEPDLEQPLQVDRAQRAIERTSATVAATLS